MEVLNDDAAMGYEIMLRICCGYVENCDYLNQSCLTVVMTVTRKMLMEDVDGGNSNERRFRGIVRVSETMKV